MVVVASVVPPVIVSPVVKAVEGTRIVIVLALSSLLSTLAETPLEEPVIVSFTAKLFADPTVSAIVLSAKLVGR